MRILEDLQQINKQKLEETYDENFCIDNILANELDELIELANKIEAKYRAIHYTKRIIQNG